MRYIKVTKYSECPYHITGDFGRSDYCTFQRHKEHNVIDKRVKTFPKFCKLNKLKQL